MMLLSVSALCPLSADGPRKGLSSSLNNSVVLTKPTAMAGFVLSDSSVSWAKKAHDSSLQILFHLEKQLIKILGAEGIL